MGHDDYKPWVFDTRIESDQKRLDKIRKDHSPKVIDHSKDQLIELALCRKPSKSIEELESAGYLEELVKKSDDLLRWVYYSWDNLLIRILAEEEFIEVRTNRNRNKITTEEQEKLRSKTIGIAGLSVGRSVALTLASERICGSFKLADFDEIELSNLNRIKCSIKDLGVNKAISAAREISMIDPYIEIECFTEGLQEDNMDSFFNAPSLDVFIEECDDLVIKIRSRLEARSNKIPVLMEASDRCLVDIERFDQEPSRPILHGIIDDTDIKNVGSLKTFEEKLALMSKIVDVNQISEGMLKSLPEIGSSLRTWPQLASDVTYGGGVMAMICRELLLDNQINSGRYYLDPSINIL